MLGLYSVFGISTDLTENLSGVNMARNAQITLHEQVLAWENILISGKNYPDFQKNYHVFSRKAESVQNTLVNQNHSEITPRCKCNRGKKLISSHKEKLSRKALAGLILIVVGTLAMAIWASS